MALEKQIIVERQIKTRTSNGPPYHTELIPLDKYVVRQATNVVTPEIRDMLSKADLIKLIEKGIDVIIK